MENIIDYIKMIKVELKKVHILQILNCYYKIFPLIYVGFDSEGITLQGSCDEQGISATRTIGRDYGHHVCDGRRSMVAAIPNCIKVLDGRCVKISVTNIDSWRVRVTFKSDNDISYEAICTHMYKLLDQPVIDSGISFERYTVAKKCLGGVDIAVSVNEGIATFRGSSFRVLTFTIGEPGQEYCKIPSVKPGENYQESESS